MNDQLNKSNQYNIYIADESEWDEWDNFNSKHGNVFQSLSFAKSYKDSGMKVRLILARDQNNKILGGTFYLIPIPKLNKFFNQLRIVSGPIILNNDKDIIDKFLIVISYIAKKEKTITIPLRTQFITNKQIFTQNNFSVSDNGPTMSYINDITLKKEEIWKNISRTQRKKINRCKNNNITIHEVKYIEDLKRFNTIYQNFAETVRSWIPIPYELFLSIFKNFNNNAKFLIAVKEETTPDNKTKTIDIAGGLFLIFNKKIIYLANGTNTNYRNFHANSLLIWHMIEWGNMNNYESLDIYGVYPNPQNNFEKGMNFFKSQFGGQLTEKFMYTNKTLSKTKLFLFRKVILPMLLPVYKKVTK